MKIQLLSLLAFLTLILSCSELRDEKIYDNPLDPNGTTYDPVLYDTLDWLAEPVYHYANIQEDVSHALLHDTVLTECKYVTTLSDVSSNSDYMSLRFGKGYGTANALQLGDWDIIRLTYRASHELEFGALAIVDGDVWGYSAINRYPAATESTTIEIVREDIGTVWGDGQFEEVNEFNLTLNPENKSDPLLLEITMIEVLYDQEKEVLPREPEILKHPQNVKETVGGEVVFSTTVLGDGIHYQWMLNSDKIGEDTNSVTVALQDGQDNAKVHCKVFNYSGLEETDDATITLVEFDTLDWLKDTTNLDIFYFYLDSEFQLVNTEATMIDELKLDISADAMPSESHTIGLAAARISTTPVGSFDKIQISYIADRDMRIGIDTDVAGVMSSTVLPKSDTGNIVTVFPESFSKNWGETINMENGFKIVFSFDTPNAPEDVKLEIRDVKILTEK